MKINLIFKKMTNFMGALVKKKKKYLDLQRQNKV